MREAYLKVLGLHQEPVQEAKKMGRPSWVPESIKDDAVSEFMSAVAAAHKEGKETFTFSEKNYKMSFGKKKESANEAVEVGGDDSELEQDAESEKCEDCGEVHEGECSTKKEELSAKQKKIDHDKDGDIDGKDLAKLRGESTEIEDTRQFRNAIALAKSQKAIRHAKYGKDTKFYADGTPVTPEETARRAAERKARKQGVAEGSLDDIEQFAADLAENGFDQDEIDSILSKLEEKKHVGTDGPDAAEPEEMGDTLSDGELDFIEKHSIEITDFRPEDPKHHEATKKATPPTTKGVGTAEVDGQKIAASKPEVAVKSQAPVPKTK